jgi:hypothetical protein
LVVVLRATGSFAKLLVVRLWVSALLALLELLGVSLDLDHAGTDE